MKLGLLGYPIDHSRSPALYKDLLGPKLTSYKLFSYEKEEMVPSLSFFSNQLNGLNITSPYKKHFVNEIIISSDLVKSLGAVNTLVFVGDKTYGTNTDLLAIVDILKDYMGQYSSLQLLLLGDGVMASVTKLVAAALGLPLKQFSRKMTEGFAHLDLTPFVRPGEQTIIINSCSRDFIFQGCLTGSEIFWDYNYSFLPHQNSLPSQVISYQDGRKMLELQAVEAIRFWEEHIPKLK